MSNPKKNFIIDPDYEILESVRERVRQKEERENRERLATLKDVINREFETELDHRQSQLDLVQQRLNQAQKMLHLLRYVLITSYYNENEKLVNQLEESFSTTETPLISHKNKLHPAIKKLLGSNLNNYKIHFKKTQRTKMKLSEQDRGKLSTTQTSGTSSTANTVDLNKSDNQHRIEELKNGRDTREEFDTGRNRKKSKYRVVVGNISKWMPSESEEDKSTHKWMVYVRGSKESPDISHFVQKVVFYLHPSYQPNDVIELREAPFHLARRGWGEFPLRVKIFFQYSLNKPVDIIHHLKLDKTFTGRQTLGNETVVNLFLYDTDKLVERYDPTLIIKNEPEEISKVDEFIICNNEVESNIQQDVVQQNYTSIPHDEHDYCFIRVKREVEDEIDCKPSTSAQSPQSAMHTHNHLTEHSYFSGNLTSNNHGDKAQLDTTQVEFVEPQTDLIYGISDVEENNSEVIIETVLDDVKVPARHNPSNNCQRVVMSNGNVIAIKKRRRPQESLLKSMFQKKLDKGKGSGNNLGKISLLRRTYGVNENVKRPKHDLSTENCDSIIDCEKYRINFPSQKFKTVSEALPYLFKRLPLITRLVSDVSYKCMYPYAAQSLEEYSTWNIGRRLSCEWFRAKNILKMLTVAEVPEVKSWTVKSIIMYARSHGFTPLSNYEIFRKKVDLPQEIVNGIGNNECSSRILEEESKVMELSEPDILVDVVNCNSEPELPKPPVKKTKLIDPHFETACSYVKQALLDVGVILKPEEIAPGVFYNAAERTLLQATLSLAEDLIRTARADLVLQGNFREQTSSIEVEDIHKALRERPQFNKLKTLINN